MKNLIIILVLFSLFSCDKKEEVEEQAIIDVFIELSVYNSQNIDLLDTANPGHLESSDIKLFYEINGNIIEVNDPNMENPRNFTIFKHTNEYRIGITMNHTETSDRPRTFIKWTEDDIDTIETIYERPNNSILKRTVLLNGIEIWNWTTNSEEYYKLIK